MTATLSARWQVNCFGIPVLGEVFVRAGGQSQFRLLRFGVMHVRWSLEKVGDPRQAIQREVQTALDPRLEQLTHPDLMRIGSPARDAARNRGLIGFPFAFPGIEGLTIAIPMASQCGSRARRVHAIRWVTEGTNSMQREAPYER